MEKWLGVALLGFMTICCQKNEPIWPCSDETGLYTLSDFPIGVAVEPNNLSFNFLYKKITQEQYNSLTPENIFKPAYLQPEPGLFYWEEADSLVAFAIRHQKRIHGHTLVWHQQLPIWMDTYSGDAAAFDSLMKWHIQTVMRHFKGKVLAWDVVNEAFEDDGSLRNSIWRQKIGDSYLEKAFVYAHEAVPEAELFYNDYSLESNATKRKAVLDFLNAMRQKGLTINGIGLQMHLNLYVDRLQIATALQDFAAQGYKIHLSEVDIALNPLGQYAQPPASLLQEQANLLGAVVLYYKQLPKKLQYGITFWGVGDAHSWIRFKDGRDDYPLLYDDNYQTKPAYCQLKELL